MSRPFMDRARKIIAGEISVPIGRTLGFNIVEIGPDSAAFEMEADADRHANPMGTLHGGVLCDLSDGAMGMAWASELEEGETFTTLELKINFLKPVWNGRLRAEARVIRRGKTVGLVTCDVRDAKGDLVAHATSTLMTLRGEKAQGR
ncbi:MAG TPA: PaaI family thioesterase [Thermoanaerobaculia bacterium]|nr:PaaI family thioesterase [Thermoanaerobaculia bacterium]